MTDHTRPDPRPLTDGCQRLRRAARLIPGAEGTLVVVIPHADWIGFCNALDGLPPQDHNRERGNYFGAIRRRKTHATIALTATPTTVDIEHVEIEEPHCDETPAP